MIYHAWALTSTINLPPITDIVYFTLKSELLTLEEPNLCIN